MSTDAQRLMLFRLFGGAVKAQGWAGGIEREMARERVTRDALQLGERSDVPSWTALTNSQVDRIKARLEALAAPDDIDAQIGDLAPGADGDRRRLVWTIERDARRAGFHDGYMTAIVRDMEDVSAGAMPWRELPLPALENLRDTIAGRSRRKIAARKKEASAGAPAPRSAVRAPRSANCPF